MKNINEELRQQYLAGTNTEKIAMLLTFAVHLTILVRGEHQESAGNKEALNETLHRIASQALALLVKSEKRYPDDVFIDMICAGAAHKGITKILKTAFVQARDMHTKDIKS